MHSGPRSTPHNIYIHSIDHQHCGRTFWSIPSHPPRPQTPTRRPYSKRIAHTNNHETQPRRPTHLSAKGGGRDPGVPALQKTPAPGRKHRSRFQVPLSSIRFGGAARPTKQPRSTKAPSPPAAKTVDVLFTWEKQKLPQGDGETHSTL